MCVLFASYLGPTLVIPLYVVDLMGGTPLDAGLVAFPSTFTAIAVNPIAGMLADKYGVRKVNVDPDCRMAMTGAIRKIFATKPEEFDVRKYMGPAMEEMQKVCEARYEQFGAAGMASKIKPISLADMAKRYKSGELDHML